MNDASGSDFGKYKISEIKHQQGHDEDRNYISVTEYRSKLGGLIARLHHTYFYDESAPFAGMPSTTINLHNNQEQTQTQSVFLEFRNEIDKKIATTIEGNEKNFLQKLKDGIDSVKDFTSLMLLVSGLAKEYSITLDMLRKIFS